MTQIRTGILRSTRIGLQRTKGRINKAALDIVRKQADRFVFEMKEIKLSGATSPPWPTKGDFSKAGRLKTRSGALRGSIKRSGIRGTQTSRTGSTSIEIRVSGGQGVVYFRVHEFGATIRAKRAPFLVFPVVGKDGKRHLVKKRSVRIPARMGFRVTFQKVAKSARLELKAKLAAISTASMRSAS